jgi:hypothetical protein
LGDPRAALEQFVRFNIQVRWLLAHKWIDFNNPTQLQSRVPTSDDQMRNLQGLETSSCNTAFRTFDWTQKSAYDYCSREGKRMPTSAEIIALRNAGRLAFWAENGADYWTSDPESVENGITYRYVWRAPAVGAPGPGNPGTWWWRRVDQGRARPMCVRDPVPDGTTLSPDASQACRDTVFVGVGGNGMCVPKQQLGNLAFGLLLRRFMPNVQGENIVYRWGLSRGTAFTQDVWVPNINFANPNGSWRTIAVNGLGFGWWGGGDPIFWRTRFDNRIAFGIGDGMSNGWPGTLSWIQNLNAAPADARQRLMRMAFEPIADRNPAPPDETADMFALHFMTTKPAVPPRPANDMFSDTCAPPRDTNGNMIEYFGPNSMASFQLLNRDFQNYRALVANNGAQACNTSNLGQYFADRACWDFNATLMNCMPAPRSCNGRPG